MSNWKVNDRAVFVSHDGSAVHPELYGEECFLVEFVGSSPSGAVKNAWRVQFSIGIKHVNERCLRPIPDDYSRFHADLIPCDTDYEWKRPERVTV